MSTIRATSAHFISIALAALLCSLQVNGQAFKPATIVDAMDAAIFLQEFKQGAELAGLLELLSSPEFEGTVFAPTDLAFQAFLSGNGITKEQLAEQPEVLKEFIGFHIVSDKKLFPMSRLTQDMVLDTAASESAKLYVDRSVPSLVHIWGLPKGERQEGSTNFATILNFQETAGNAVLYTIDRPLVPPKMTELLSRTTERTEALAGPAP